MKQKWKGTMPGEDFCKDYLGLGYLKESVWLWTGVCDQKQGPLYTGTGFSRIWGSWGTADVDVTKIKNVLFHNPVICTINWL